MAYLDNTGLSHFWDKIKDYITGLGYYSKPSGGIPSSDLASAVQASLGKADTAIQSSDLATVATTGDYDDLVNAPQYVICTLADYNAMASHDADTYYIII